MGIMQLGCAVFLVMLLTGCASSAKIDWSKFDPMLRREMAVMAMAGASEDLTIRGITGRKLSAKQQTTLQKTGIQIRTFSGQHFVAWGSFLQIQQVARLDFVRGLQLAGIADHPSLPLQ